jgi:hypothetical protein
MWPRTAFLLSYKDTSRKEIDGETRPPKEIDSEIFKNLPAEMRPKLIAAVPESHKK